MNLKKKKNEEKGTEYYTSIEEALQWKNISNLIYKNHTYLNLTIEEANKAVNELNVLICLKFSSLEKHCPGSINPLSNFSNFWNTLHDFEYKDGCTFATLSKIAFRLYPICCSEAGAERVFSRLKWKYPDRRSRTNKKLMINEMHIDNAFTNKLKSSENFKNTMWQLPPHNQ